MNEGELIYKEIINPEILKSMEIEIEIHKLKNNNAKFEKYTGTLPITFSYSYHQGTGDILDDLLLGRQPAQIRENFVKDYTRGGKDRMEFEEFNSDIFEKTMHVTSDVKEKLTNSFSQITDTIKGVFKMGKEFLNS
jgi:hypothetical protein